MLGTSKYDSLSFSDDEDSSSLKSRSYQRGVMGRGVAGSIDDSLVVLDESTVTFAHHLNARRVLCPALPGSGVANRIGRPSERHGPARRVGADKENTDGLDKGMSTGTLH